MPTTTKEGHMENLKLILSKNLVLRLFENDIKPDYYSTVSDFKEVNGGGYTPKVLNASKWKFGFVEDIPAAAYPEQLFVFTGPIGLIYGFYLTDGNGKVVRMAERFADGPYEVLRMKDNITVVARVRLPVLDKPKEEE
jgi:hypothetical protein